METREMDLTMEGWAEEYMRVYDLLYGPLNLLPQKREDQLQPVVIDLWGESYLDVYETLYGPLNLHPKKTIAEINDEWIANFRPDVVANKSRKIA